MSCSIYYATFYGSTREYADALADRLGTWAQELPDPKRIDAAHGVPLVILSPIHGPTHPGVRFIKDLPGKVVASRPIALVTVGMSLIDEATAQDPVSTLLGNLSGWVTRFYLPGRMNYSELTPTHAALMRGMVGALRLKPVKSANERSIISMYGTDVDLVDLALLDPVVEWVESVDPEA